MSPRIGGRVLLLDHDRVLLMHALDPDLPENHWWELPGGGVDDGETVEQAAVRELAEEAGIQLGRLAGPCLWVRESRFRYRNQAHHRLDHVFLGNLSDASGTVDTKPTENERLGMLEQRWFTVDDLRECRDKLVPPELPTLLPTILSGSLPTDPLILRG